VECGRYGQRCRDCVFFGEISSHPVIERSYGAMLKCILRGFDVRKIMLLFCATLIIG
jgi:hypothetical protein